ncbi:MAG TPA: carbon monoxide dehydrogenase subunit G [Paucimonas sp.]|nr:carbon monoxide dehydrogenase subunit G [Paucimonas sp.]
MSKTQIVPAARDRVWSALNDPELLKVCITGCQAIELVSENTYQVALAVKIGPVNAKFAGKITLADLNPPDSYTLNFEGQGGMAGFAKGVARVTLSPDDDGVNTRLAYTAAAQIGGKLAQIGSRLVDGTANKMAAEFFAALAAALEGEPETKMQVQTDELQAQPQPDESQPRTEQPQAQQEEPRSQPEEPQPMQPPTA